MLWRDKDLLTSLTSNATWQRYCEVFRKPIFKSVSGSGTIVSPSAQLSKESISKATAAASAQVSRGPFRELNCHLRIWLSCAGLKCTMITSVVRRSVRTETLKGRSQSKFVKIISNILSLVINIYVSVMSNRAGTRYNFTSSLTLWDNSGNPDIRYVEPSSDTNCLANGTCIINSGFASKCLNILKEHFSKNLSLIALMKTMQISEKLTFLSHFWSYMNTSWLQTKYGIRGMVPPWGASQTSEVGDEWKPSRRYAFSGEISPAIMS
jgi:hypothetical protein